MALPTITSNSPIAGSIAWTAFAIQYGGTSYSIAASNTSSKFVWWLYNGGSPVLTSGNTLPDLGPDDLLLFLNKGGIGALVPTMNAMDGSLIVNGSILAAAISADQINAGHIQADAITSSELAANAVTASEVAAGAITTEKLSVGSVGDSLVTNGSFEEFDAGGMPLGWQILNTPVLGSVSIVTGIASSGTNALQLGATATTSNANLGQKPEKYIPVSATSGRKWYISARMGAGTATTAGGYLRAAWYDANKTYLSYTDVASNAALATTWAVYEGQVTPPSTARYMGLQLYIANPNVATNMYVDEVTAREVVISAIIGDGAITTPKMTANSIAGNVITANTIAGDKIVASSITTDRLLVSDRTNYWENPDFETDTVGGIPKGTTLTDTTNARVLGAGATGSSKSMEINALNGSNNDVYGSNTFPVEPGDQYYVAYDYKFLNTVGTAAGTVGFRTYGPTKAGISWWGVGTGSARPTAWQENLLYGVYTVPAGTYYLQPWVTFQNNAETTNRFHVDNIIMRRMSGGELIVDGAIIATKIATDAVTSTKIIANAITSNHISANAIVANSIAVGALDGKVITGATVQTAASGARVVLDSTGLKAWDANAKQYLTANSAGVVIDGTLDVLGTGYTANTAPGAPAGSYVTFPVKMIAGAGAGSQSGLQTEQLPPAPNTGGPPVAGITFNQVGTTMQDYAGMTSEKGVGLFLSGGRTRADVMANVSNWQSSTLGLSDNAATFSKVVSAPAFTVGGVSMATAAICVYDFASVAAASGMVTPPGAGTYNASLSTDSSWNSYQSAQPGSIYITSAGVYDIDTHLSLDGIAGTRAFIDVEQYVGTTATLLGRFTFTGDDTVHGSLNSIMLASGTYIRLRVYQQSGASRSTTSARLRIKKVVGPSPSATWNAGDRTITGNLTVSANTSTTNLTVSGETTIKHRRAEFNNGGFGVAANQVWDIGTQTIGASPGTLNNDFCQAGPYSGSIGITKNGYYAFQCFVAPQGAPGGTWLRAMRGSDSRNLGQTSNGSAWENTLTTLPFYYAAGDYVRFAYSSTLDHTIKSWVTATQPY